MFFKVKELLCGMFLFMLSLSVGAQEPQSDALERKRIWSKISRYFTPPAEFRGDFGSYRSLLEFYDGRKVKTKADWPARRQEIYNRWSELMGRWPALLTDQKLTILDSVQEEGYKQYKVKFRWLPNEETTGFLLVPDGDAEKPAVISVYYEPNTAIGDGKPYRDYALQLVKRGFVTLSLGTTEASKDQTFSLYYPSIEKAEVQPLSMLAYAAANAWHALAKENNVDSTRIGIVGHSFGGKWAMFASTLFDKFACAVWSDPGIVFDEARGSVNYWEPWYLGYHPKPWRKRGMITEENPVVGLYPRLVEEGYDLHELHALMAPRPFLVSGGSEDPPSRWIPLNHTIKVNDLLGYENRVAMSNRPEHSPNEEANEIVYSFFEYFLKYNGIETK
ncbi:alpha/beta hydrolase family protein [Albibacterium indicum]|uniref:alpha/beta hydrolase family protein n=1 Tax=Albibacterium indicum TaxID=2292082 RepID=UPI000E4CF80D|nr:prolyl oligopeptidase family serine peptidase [Pedobacter indicus]